MRFLTSKKFWIPVAVIVFILSFLTAYGAYRDRVVLYFQEKRETRLLQETERVLAEIDAAYRSDFDGGKTPEETVELFIAALQNKDAHRASKYYELSVQPKALAGLEEEFREKGNYQLSIDYFTEVKTKGEKKCNERGDGCTFEYIYITKEDRTVLLGKSGDKLFVPTGSESAKAFDLTLNDKTGVWKITQPF